MIKLAVIGGGGVRSPQLARSLAQHAKKLGIDEIAYMDNDERKLRIYGGISREVAARLAPELKFMLTGDGEEAVRDADYVITTIRAGGDDMRVKDEKIALDKHILGQETTGAAGFSFAMRSVPALVEYCELVKKYAKKGAKVFNFTNPAGVVSQTLQDMGYDFTYGICDSPSGLLRGIAKICGVGNERVSADCYGLNHLSYFSHIYLDGKDIFQELIKNPLLYTETEMRFFTPEFTERIGALCNEYLYYFYSREKAVDNILHAGVTRGEVISGLNRKMTDELEGLNPEKEFDRCVEVYEKWYGQRAGAYMQNETGVPCTEQFRFDIHEPDDGGYAGVALKFIEAVQREKETGIIMCVPNQGAIDGLRDEDVVEITCKVSREGCRPVKMGDIPELQMEMIRRVKIYERYASMALRKHSKQDALWCLANHPLVNSYTLAEELVKEYLELNRDFAGEWG